MANSRFPTVQLFSPEFVITSGTILFRRGVQQGLEVCILRHLTKDEWLLPKGRKDRGESIEQCALRETFEETGYPCRHMPLKMWTRAPLAGSDVKDVAVLARNATEPFAVTMRNVGPSNTKFIWWFVAESTGAPKVEGTQMGSEGFASEFLAVDEAIARLTFASDREVVEKAVSIVRASVLGSETEGL